MGKKNKTCGDDDDDLPLLFSEDFLIQEILVCLPVKSLLRFKSVCKSWLELIESSFFIHLHTSTTFNSSSTSSKLGTFILQTNTYQDDIKLFLLSSSGSGDHGEDDDDDNEDDQKKKKTVFKVDDDLGFLPFYKDYLLQDSVRMVGSCNGIICLHDPHVMEDSLRVVGLSQHHYSNLRDVFLWNPATRQFRILPKSIPIKEKQYEYYYGHLFEEFVAFGYDVQTKDYKVLRITPSEVSEEGGCMCRVQVYSLSTDSWRFLEGINSLPVAPTQERFRNHGIYLNGSYFFVGRKRVLGKNDEMILSFDFTKEIFTTMQLPDNNNSSNSVLSYLGDKMVVFTTPRIDSDGGGYWNYDDDICVLNGGNSVVVYDIWVFNEQHGSGGGVNKESWTKLHSFRMKIRGLSYSEPNSEPRCISNNGEFAFISIRTYDWRGHFQLQLFNLVTKEVKKNDFLINTKVCRADVYKESLVSIMGGGNVLLKWQLPTHGTTYKLNLDSPFLTFDRPLGIGLCLTSDTGGCIGVRSVKGFVRDVAEGEALAMLEAIKWAKKLELSPIVIESDSKKCLSFFMDDDDDNNNSTYWSSEALSLLREAKLLLLNSSETGISFQYCSRSSNYVADIAAKLSRDENWTSKEWTANFPGEMVRSLSKDLGSET